MLLGIDWMDPNWLLDRFGAALFWISLVIIFVECGLFFPFLPGDTLLFAIGLFIATEQLDVFPGPPLVELSIAMVLLIVAAFLGNVVGYEIGRKIGPPLYERDGRILKRKYFDQTTAFFDRHGNKALVIGRFVPFVRTYITVVAGVTRMDRARFFLWSLVGAVLWVVDLPARLLPGRRVPDAGREHRLRDPRDPGLLGHPDPHASGGATAHATPMPRSARRTVGPTATSRGGTSTGPRGSEGGSAQPRAASRSALVSTARTSRPTSASGFSPSGERSIAQTTTSTVAPASAQRARGVADRAAGGDHVLDEGDPPARDVRALGELAGAVLLGLLAHEERRQPGLRRHHGGDRDAAELEPAEQLGALREQVDHLRGDPRSSSAGSASKRYLSK